jgi:hypothetical protein
MVWYGVAQKCDKMSNGCVSPVGGCDHYHSVLGGAETVPFLGREREGMRREEEKEGGKRERKMGERKGRERELRKKEEKKRRRGRGNDRRGRRCFLPRPHSNPPFLLPASE